MGFQSARREFGDLYSYTTDEVNKLLADLWNRGQYTKAKEIEEQVNKILDDANADQRMYDTAWDTIRGKVEPVATPLVPEDESRTEYVIALMLLWNSFGKLLPNRLNNTNKLIRNEYVKTTKRVYREVLSATNKLDVNAKVGGQSLSKSVKEKFQKEIDRKGGKPTEFLQQEFGKLAEKVTQKKLKKTPKHYAERVTETEALTMRMDTELKVAEELNTIDFITISVKPNACAVCQSYIGQKYKKGMQPHLLVHPNCRCDYVIHYTNGQTLLIAGSGRVDLIS